MRRNLALLLLASLAFFGPVSGVPTPTLPGLVAVNVPNAGSTGTTVNKLAKINSSGAAVIAATTDTDGMLGVVLSGAGITGSAQIATSGIVSCTFDGTATDGDYVQISSSVAGDCKDTGASTRPNGGQVIGRVVAGGSGTGTYTLSLQIASPAGTSGSAGGGLSGTYPNPTVAAVPASAMPALTGDVTSSAGSVATTLAAIGGLANVAPTAWTPADGSGASLTFTGVSANYTRVGNMIFAYASLTYPSTANGSNASISGLPVNAPSHGYGQNGCTVSYANSATGVTHANIGQGTGTISLYNSTGTNLTNSQMSTTLLMVMCIYPAT